MDLTGVCVTAPETFRAPSALLTVDLEHATIKSEGQRRAEDGSMVNKAGSGLLCAPEGHCTTNNAVLKCT